MRDPKERLIDILDAIVQIEKYASQGRKIFEKEELIQVWIIHHLQIIGEAASKLGNDFHKLYPEIPWAQIIAMRNILIHEYFAIDLEEIWATVEKDLPKLKKSHKKNIRRYEITF